MVQGINQRAVICAVAGCLNNDITGKAEIIPQRPQLIFGGVTGGVLALRRKGEQIAGTKQQFYFETQFFRDRRLADALAAVMIKLAKRLGVSSLHVTFPEQTEWKMMGELGYMQRVGQQFHWENKGFETFDDFLRAKNLT